MSIYNEIRQQFWQDFEEKSKIISEQEKSAIEVVIKADQLDTTKIKDYQGENFKSFEFRPQNWDQFIGQEEAKERAKTIIKKIDKGLRSHFLVDGIKGHGKTSYVELLAKNANAHLIKTIGKQVNIDNIITYLNEIQLSQQKNIIFFIDELDTMDKNVIKVLNPIIESFEVSGKKLKPFIFAGATINKHLLLKNNPDTLDRIPIHIKFKRYNAQEILTILNQYIQQLYLNEVIIKDDLDIISQNCKFNPRTSIALLEEYVVEKDIVKVLKNWNIIKDGLTNIDVDILKTLSESKRAVGANALAMKVGLTQSEYIIEFESYLIEQDYINRVPSRIITEKGKKFLKCL